MFFSHLKRGFNLFIAPLVDHFIRKGYHPDTFTILGLVFNTIAAVLYAFGRFFEAGLIMCMGSSTDLIDGQIARSRGTISTAGALLDSSLDRYSETVVLTGLIVYYSLIGWVGTVLAAALTISGSMMVSYVRARAEALNYDCQVGFMQRPERVIFLAAASVYGPFLGTANATVAAALWLMAIATHYTSFERIIHVRRIAKEFDRLQNERNSAKIDADTDVAVAPLREENETAIR
jgi:CDP-diacylglycerol---glycerol-3-phosphate 3-phosphatidyltransferase